MDAKIAKTFPSAVTATEVKFRNNYANLLIQSQGMVNTVCVHFATPPSSPRAGGSRGGVEK